LGAKKYISSTIFHSEDFAYTTHAKAHGVAVYCLVFCCGESWLFSTAWKLCSVNINGSRGVEFFSGEK